MSFPPYICLLVDILNTSISTPIDCKGMDAGSPWKLNNFLFSTFQIIRFGTNLQKNVSEVAPPGGNNNVIKVKLIMEARCIYKRITYHCLRLIRAFFANFPRFLRVFVAWWFVWVRFTDSGDRIAPRDYWCASVELSTEKQQQSDGTYTDIDFRNEFYGRKHYWTIILCNRFY